MLVAASRSGSRPLHRTCEQVRVHQLEQVGRTSREGEGLSRFFQDRGVYANRRNHIEITANGLADHELRPQDGPRPMLAGLLFANIIFLKPIKVFVRMAWRPLARGTGAGPM